MAGGEGVQLYAMVLGGMEAGYMKKLALYLNDRTEQAMRVGIVQNPAKEQLGDPKTIWIGSEKFIKSLKGRVQSERFIVLSEESDEKDEKICRYQSCGKLYQEIMLRCQRYSCLPAAEYVNTKQRWILMTTDGTQAELMAFSLTCAMILGEKGKVLYLNFSQCCGMWGLLCQEEGRDLGDLILALRRGEDFCLDVYTGRLENVDYLMPPANPMILHELREEDMERLMQTVQKDSRYTFVVAALGTVCCGSELLFSVAKTLYHLHTEGHVLQHAKNEWERFARLCMGERRLDVKEVTVPPIESGVGGRTEIEELANTAMGQTARRLLEGEDMDEEG